MIKKILFLSFLAVLAVSIQAHPYFRAGGFGFLSNPPALYSSSPFSSGLHFGTGVNTKKWQLDFYGFIGPYYKNTSISNPTSIFALEETHSYLFSGFGAQYFRNFKNLKNLNLKWNLGLCKSTTTKEYSPRRVYEEELQTFPGDPSWYAVKGYHDHTHGIVPDLGITGEFNLYKNIINLEVGLRGHWFIMDKLFALSSPVSLKFVFIPKEVRMN